MVLRTAGRKTESLYMKDIDGKKNRINLTKSEFSRWQSWEGVGQLKQVPIKMCGWGNP